MKLLHTILLIIFPTALIGLAFFFYQHISSGVYEIIAFIISSNLLLLYTLFTCVVLFKLIRNKLALLGIEITTIFYKKSDAISSAL